MKNRLILVVTTICLMWGAASSAMAKPVYSSWAEEYFVRAEEAGIIPDTIADSNLTEKITREQFCELAYLTINTIDLPKEIQVTHMERNTRFTDCGNPAVLALKTWGIISGKTNTKFAPDDFITREEAAAIIVRMVDCLRLTKFESTESFSDKREMASWSRESISIVCGMNIMSGIGDGQFAPKAAYTKEQAVSTMIRLIDFVPENASEKIDGSRYYKSNKYFRWVENKNRDVLFQVSSEEYSVINFYSNGEKVLAFAVSQGGVDVFDIDSGELIFSIPQTVVGVYMEKYIVVSNENGELFGVYDFHGNMVVPVECTWEYLYSKKYVNSAEI